MVLWLLVSCVVNSDGPATPGSAAAEAQQEVAGIIERAARIEALSTELEGMTDGAREAMPGRPRRDQIEQMRALMTQIEEENAALQAALQALDSSLHESAGDPTWSTNDESSPDE